MYVQIIQLEEAVLLEDQGKITIVDTDSSQEVEYHSKAPFWKQNYTYLRQLAPQVQAVNVFQYFPTPYLIEVIISEDPDTNSIHWKYLKGVANTTSTVPDGVEYVYILTNRGYPGLLKIGMTTKTPERRLKGINSTGTVDTWQLAFSIPLRAGTAFKVENQVHKLLNPYRFHAERAYDREMFRVDLPEAIEVVRRVGEYFRVGKLNFYN